MPDIWWPVICDLVTKSPSFSSQGLFPRLTFSIWNVCDTELVKVTCRDKVSHLVPVPGRHRLAHYDKTPAEAVPPPWR